ncbi:MULTISPECIES: helix-turn-helix domain-containing protein [unclassified Bradyrhizobium]|uniref:helix-turn-helix domain-containing protein n=1 Tax=unclassified Bradyrhizobium TaxID=2631580 RepID=UPI00201374F0|nr:MULTISPECIES: helix-turn-helix domain-containing protein [unclassified Bradyrhizobium]
MSHITEIDQLRSDDFDRVKSLPLFARMTEQSLDNLLQGALLQQFPVGVHLIHEGDAPDFLHVLIDGLVEIFTEQDGVEWGISLLAPVSTFILAAVVGDQRYLNSARTLKESRILLIPAQGVRTILRREIEFAQTVTSELASAYRGAVKKLKGYVARSSVERLANWILSEAQSAASGKHLVLPFDRATLASHIGTTRENLSRNLAHLTEHGVRIRGREIIIDRRDLLEAFARPQRFIDDPNS